MTEGKKIKKQEVNGSQIFNEIITLNKNVRKKILSDNRTVSSYARSRGNQCMFNFSQSFEF